MDKDQDDAAQRLHDILTVFQSLQSSKGNHALQDVLSEATGGRGAGFAVVTIAGLLHQVQHGLRRMDGLISASSYLDQVAPIERWLGSLNLSSAAERQAVDDRAVSALVLCSDQLQRARSLQRIDQEDVDRLRRDAEQLLDEVRSSAIDASLRAYLLDVIRSFIAALDHYDTFGSAGVDDAIRHAIGEIAVRRPRAETTQERTLIDKLKSMFVGFVALMGTADLALNYAANMRESFDRLVAESDDNRGRELESGAKPPLGLPAGRSTEAESDP